MPNPDLTKLVDEVGDKIETIVKSSNGWLTKIGQIVEVVVPEVETIGETWNGSEKKELAMTLIDQIWFKYFDLKRLPNFIEKILVNNVSSFAIDKLVKILNKTGVFVHRSNP